MSTGLVVIRSGEYFAMRGNWFLFSPMAALLCLSSWQQETVKWWVGSGWTLDAHRLLCHSLCLAEQVNIVPLHSLLRERGPHILPLLQCMVALTGDSPPQTSPALVIPMGCSSSLTALPWVLSTGYSPAGTDFSSVSPSQSQILPANLLHVELLYMDPHILPEACSSMGLPELGTPSHVPTCSRVGWSPPSTSACSCLGLHHGLQGRSLFQYLEHLPLLLYWPWRL